MYPWWRGAVLYQVYPRSFSDGNGDGVGDLPGITERLDYVAGLGVDGIWLSPFFVSPMKDFGYDVADYRDVDPVFGTLADFDRLLARAHALGLKVVIDQVYSHTSDAHPWFAESRRDRSNPRAGWYVWADPRPDGTPPNNWLSIFGGPAWEWDSRRRQYYLHNFLKEQPDLDLHHPEVQEAILDVARFWLDRGVDGFRLDVANFYMHDPLLRDNPPRTHPDPVKPYLLQSPVYNRSRPENLAFIARLRRVMDAYPGTMTVAELSGERPVETMIAYTVGPDRLHTAYSFVFLKQDFSAAFIRETVESMGAAWPSWAFSNHDVVRVATRWGGERPSSAFAGMLIALLATLRGTAFLYQGEELGLPEAEVPFENLRDPDGIAFWPGYKGRDGCRTPMPWAAAAPHAGFSASSPWLPVDPAHRALAVDLQEADPASTLSFTRAFLAWRRLHPALARGDIRFWEMPEPVLGFERGDEGERLGCLFNLGRESVSVRLPVGVSPLGSSFLTGASIDGLEVRLAPSGVAVIIVS
ncbi:MAG: alpha glucosidase [Alphaproteobacteria bacterium]|nr:alpha glucosidase [Alphaproteobacteria bacterium]